MIEFSALKRREPFCLPGGLPASDEQVQAATRTHQGDAANRRRLRWRARRGLLENDLVLTRFLDLHEVALTDGDVTGLHRLLDLTDNELMDLLLDRCELQDDFASPDVIRVLGMLRAV